MHFFVTATTVFLILVPAARAISDVSLLDRARWGKVLDEVPFYFEPNAGQIPGPARFLARAGNYRLYVGKDEVILAAGCAVTSLVIEGANDASRWEGLTESPGYSNYFIGRDPAGWRRRVPHFASIVRNSVYPQIAMVFRDSGRRLEYEFRIAPGGDPGAIRLRVAGADRAAIDPLGNLVVRAGGGEFRHRAPRAWQQTASGRRAVGVRFTLRDTVLGFEVDGYDPARELIIDPILSFHGYLGGTALDSAVAAAIGENRMLTFTGWSDSLEYPTGGSPYRNFNSGARDIFVTRLQTTGAFAVYSTYIGGTGNEEPAAISLDSVGNSYITGKTTSTNFPTFTTSFQKEYGGNTDGFVVKLNPEGSSLVYSSYLGGSGEDAGTGIASDYLGYATVAGYTASTDFPLHNAHQSNYGGGATDMFLFRLHANSVETVYSTYFGGAAADRASAVALDGQTVAYVAGRSDCSTLSPGAAIGPLGGQDVVVAKWKSNGAGPEFLTCAGGTGADSGEAIAVDAQGRAYVTGYTDSADFPFLLGLQPSYGGAAGGSIGDAFLLRLNAAGGQLEFSTYLGGQRDDWGQSIALDAAGNAWIAGITYSANFPSANQVAPPGSGNRSGFLIRVKSTGMSVLDAAFFEGIKNSDRYGVAIDSRQGVFVVGGTALGFRPPTTSGLPIFPSVNPPRDEAFVAKLSEARLQLLQDTFSPVVVAGEDFTIVQRLINRGPNDASSILVAGALPAETILMSCTATGVTCLRSGNSFQITLPELLAGKGVEIRLTARIAPGTFPGLAIPITSSVVSQTYDSQRTDNLLTTTVFSAAAPSVCNYIVEPRSVVLPAASGNTQITINAPFSCPWSITSATDWLNVTSATLGSGATTVTVAVTANPSATPRAGSVIVAGQRVLLVQRGTNTPVFFNDVPASHPFFEAIEIMRAYGVTLGCTGSEYCPDDNTTRGQMAVFIVRALLGTDEFSYPVQPFFGDVDAGHPQFRYIQKLRELGITNGCDANNYCPDQSVSREQMALFLVRAKLAVGAGQTYPFPDRGSFQDVPPASFAYAAVEKMRELGITIGCTASLYCPAEPTTRGQMALFLVRAFFAP